MEITKRSELFKKPALSHNENGQIIVYSEAQNQEYSLSPRDVFYPMGREQLYIVKPAHE